MNSQPYYRPRGMTSPRAVTTEDQPLLCDQLQAGGPRGAIEKAKVDASENEYSWQTHSVWGSPLSVGFEELSTCLARARKRQMAQS